MKTKHRTLNITERQIGQWAHNLTAAIGGPGYARPHKCKRDVIGPVVDDSDHGPVISASPVQVASLAVLLSQGSKGKLVPAQCVPEALDLVTFTAGIMGQVNFRLSMALGTQAEPPDLTLGEAMHATGLKERSLRDHVRRLCPKLCADQDWKRLKTDAILPQALVLRIRKDMQTARKARSAKARAKMKQNAES